MKGEAMDEQTKYSPALELILEVWEADADPLLIDWMKRREAWERDREATEALLLGMLEKLPPAAQETTPYWTQTFACTAQQHLPANQHSFGPVTWCAECGSLRLLPGQWENPRRLLQLPAPQQTEG
jgi:hypothetical protein